MRHFTNLLRIVFLLFVGVLWYGHAAAQVTLSGKVIAENDDPLPGVNVIVKGTTQGTTTDADGTFRIQVPDAASVVAFSFVGYLTEEVTVGTRTTIDVRMTPDISTLQEVVVIGYGTQTKEQVTTAIASVKEKDFTVGAMRDASELIKGKVAGLTITNGSGDPAAGPVISLRGVNTLEGNAAPLILIDGIPGGFNTVSPQDIASVEVLKDASAAAIYGTRGANGVIIITTKSGKDKAPSVTYSHYSAFSKMSRKAAFMTASDYKNTNYNFLNGFETEATNNGGLSDTDWLGEISRTGYMQSHNLAVQGGNARTNYSANINYINQTGVFKGSYNKELRASINLNQLLFNDKVKLNLNILRGVQQISALGGGSSFNSLIYRNALIRNPFLKVRNDNGSILEVPQRLQYINPVGLIDETDGEITNNWTRLTSNISVDLAPGFETNLMVATEIRNGYNGYAETKQHYNSLYGPKRNGYAQRGDDENTTNYLEYTARYSRNMGEHSASILGGYSYQYNVNQGGFASNFDFPTNAYSYNNLGAGNAMRTGQARMDSYKNDNTLIGFFGRASYSFREKINVLASIRREGSSKFGDNNKWGTFPSVSAGWILSKESFLDDVSMLNLLKLRAGYGVTGVMPLSSYLSMPLLSYDGAYVYYNDKWINGLQASSNPNPNLRWEKSAEVNVGVDFGLFSDRLSGSVDVYVKNTSGMLYDYRVPQPPNLYPTTKANVGEMQNKGVELLLRGTPMRRGDFEWNVITTASTNRNKLKSLSNDLYTIEGDYINLYGISEPISMKSHRLEVGKAIGTLWGLKSVDISEDGLWVIELPNGTRTTLTDNALGNDDANNQVLGNGIPKYRLGLTNNFRYKNFDLSVVMNGAFGFQIWNLQRMFYENPNISYNVLKSALDNVYGKRQLAYTRQTAVSYYVENGDYMKIDNATLGYTLNNGQLKYCRSLRLYVSASNLAFITKYKGIDPEIDRSSLLYQGIDNRDKYPTTRTYTIGLNVIF